MKRVPTISEKTLFTGGKGPEFAVFYNIAFSRVENIVKSLIKKSADSVKSKKENSKNQHQTNSKFNSSGFNKILKDIESQDSNVKELIYSKFKDFFWKGYTTAKNSSGSELKQEEIKLIQRLILKLDGIRNFHSHIYHDNSILKFDSDLKEDICRLFKMAKLHFMERYPNEVHHFDEYNSKFQLFDEKFRITKEGRTFFLSFFLTRGEMSKFMDQRKGSKRNDSDKFRIKRYIYLYYTHRDGATRQQFGQDDSLFNSLSEVEKSQILNLRQGYKIISYLNDKPKFLNDPLVFAIYHNGKHIDTLEDMFEYCTANKLFVQFTFEKDSRITKDDERFIYEDRLLFRYRNSTFKITKIDFNKLLIDVGRSNVESKIYEKLDYFIRERQRFIDLLTETDFSKLISENGKFTFTEEFDQYYKLKLRNSELQEQFGYWLEKASFASLPFDSGEINAASINLHYYDFFFEEGYKQRYEDKFVEFASQYLIDFKIVPNWLWLCEKFETVEEDKVVEENGRLIKKKIQVNKRVTSFFNQIPNGYRLSITKDFQVTVGVYSNETSEHILDGKAPKHKFLIGHRAMRNLLIAYRDNKNISNFLLPQDLIAKINSIKDKTNLDLLRPENTERYWVPESFQNHLAGVMRSSEEINAKAIQRIETIINVISNSMLGNRSEKNRQIMRCYKYFDWQYPDNTEFKFLRKDEYQKMSIYHYCLKERRPIQKLNSKHKFDFLISEFESRIPNTLKSVLCSAKDLNDLLAKTVEETTNLLNSWKNLISTNSNEFLEHIYKKLGLTVSNEPVLSEHIPFDVHPLLVLKKFYKYENKGNNFEKFSLSARIWSDNSNYRNLNQSNYEYRKFLEICLPSSELMNIKIRRKIIGKINDLSTHDILLWEIANKYINISIDSAVLEIHNEESELKVENIRQSAIRFKVVNLPDFSNVILELKVHQLSDYLFVESQENIRSAIWQVLNRTKVDKSNSKIVVQYDEVFKEINRIYSESVNWALHILNWERSIIDNQTDENLIKISKEKLPPKLRHIDFDKVRTLANVEDELGESLKDIRNNSFHAKIPEKWSYWQMEENYELCKLLNYKPKLTIEEKVKKYDE